MAPSTHSQALAAVLFLYREVLAIDLPWMKEMGRPKKREHLPVVLSRAEVTRLLDVMGGVEGDLARLLYGTGMRLMEALRLCVKDVDFDLGEIAVREGKGFKSRVTMLAEKLVTPMRRHLTRVKALYEADLAAGFGEVYLPWALERKYPSAAREWTWQ